MIWRSLFISSICGCLVLAAPVSLVMAAAAWEKVRKTSDGVSVFLREVADTSVKEVKASVVVKARPLTVLDAACDPRTFRKSLDYVEANQFILTKNRNIWFNYQRLSFPIISKRDYTLRYERTMDADKKIYRLSFQAVKGKGPSPIEDVIRVTQAKGRLEAVPLDGGQLSRLDYYVITDPGGSLPGWIVNLANSVSVPNILREIREEAIRREKAGYKGDVWGPAQPTVKSDDRI